MMADQQYEQKLRIERNEHSFVVDHDRPERTATVLIDVVASLRDVDQTTLEPLYNTVDPEALGSLCTSTDCSLRISFQYEGYAVTISGDGRIKLVETSEDK
ncbi:HalOD1 output domain-containing protein [Natranaeroarchaeum sulfidigenes]|uniref:Halobacterial output domain-containing protein n=1 Tax=Natranaeroarchaeum sulfidigenes TaxID=2784880 RepID=A0A897MW33_9EURY|nr:HalOD1 output domain-containing protein [Natranaeroarchaeum sulfidigenes]QSG03303.1 Uncharacterized protein AArcS_2103 [Natranaeroarchaeum sulfidigenes]